MTSFRRTWTASHKTKAATGYRSGLEVELAKHLDENAVEYLYEKGRVLYTKPAFYLTDFILTKQAIVIEAKGAFDSSDRSKMLRVKEEHPNLDIRFLFSNPNTRIGKLSKTTYAMWCDKHRFPYAKGPKLPPQWLTHTPSATQVEALQRILHP